MLLFCFVAVMNTEVVPSSARNLKSTTTATTSPEVVTSTENIEHHHKVEADARSNYKVEKKEDKYDKNQIFPPMLPLPPLPLPNIPGLPPALPLPPVTITHAHFSAPSPPT